MSACTIEARPPTRKLTGARRLLSRALVLLAILVCGARVSPAMASADPWAALRSGDHLVLMRHAIAPGVGDPAGFDVEDCSTQRNLNEEGRAQARAIGALFRSNGVRAALVYSSQWCRCLETARLLELGAVRELPALNSFFDGRDRARAQTDATRAWIEKAPLTAPTVLVTHQVNITALTGYTPQPGEIVFVKRAPGGALSVAGTVRTGD